jgi:hypothetical protein
MKKKSLLSFMLMFILLLPIISLGNSSVASAEWRWDRYQAPVLSSTSKTLEGSLRTFELTLYNVNTYVKRIRWYTLNDKVATVKAANNGRKATVTSVNSGNTNIRCKITFTDRKSVNLYCKVTVKAGATGIEITNKRNDKDYRQIIEIGDTYDFNSKITPGNANEKTYWFINDEYYAEVDSDGVVLAKNTGIVTLTAVAALTKEAAAYSKIRDQVQIEIVDFDNGDDRDYQPQAKLINLVRSDKNRLTATFDRSIQTPGLVLVNNGTECIEGKTDPGDSKKVNYTLSSVSAQLTGQKEVSIGYWEGYQVAPDNNASDKFMKINVDFTINGINPLPAPVSITQSQSDNNVIILQFNTKVDKASAENEANYIIAGVAINSAELVAGSGDTSVRLTVKPGTIPTNGNYLATISGIKGYNNSYTVMNPCYVSLSLKENIAPAVTGFYYTYPVTVTITFSEAIKGSAGFKAIQDNKDYVSYSVIDNNKVIITLKETPAMNRIMQVIPAEYNMILDMAGNKASSALTKNITPNNN